MTVIFAVAGLAAVLLFLPLPAHAVEVREEVLRVTSDPRAILALSLFFVAYFGVMLEERLEIRKAKPVLLGAVLIWVIIGIGAPDYGVTHEQIHEAILHDLDEYASLALFLLAAMTYVNALEERNVFGALRSAITSKGFSYRQLFWVTGFLTFFLSPVADNLTTALIMGSIIMALGADQPKFVLPACVNVVVAANAGGAFSPFGDITTLMAWQAGHVEFFGFFALFLPSLVNFIVPAAVMTFVIPAGSPAPLSVDATIKRGGKTMIALFGLTIAMAVSFEQVLGLPPFMGMIGGLSLLMFWGYYLRRSRKDDAEDEFDIFQRISRAEWDTLFFFFGVIFAVGGLAYIGFLELASAFVYGDLGPTPANIILGAASAIIDNIPIMFAVLTMNPEMDQFQWLLITLTCGVGGSLLSIGSAAGVALMGVARGAYTFGGHLRWTPVIALGYAAAIFCHFLVNG